MSENNAPKLPEVQAPRPRQALVLFLIAAAGLLLTPLLSSLLSDLNTQALLLLVNLLFYLLFLGLPCFLAIKKGPGTLESLRPNPISPFSAFFICVLAVLCVFFVNDILVLWSIPFQKLGFNVNSRGLEIPSSRTGLTLCILYAAVLPGVFEELLFRGVILSAFEKQGTKKAVLFSSLLFMLLHGAIVGMPGQLLLGMIIAELVICCNSIYAGLIFHTAYNALTILIQHWQSMDAAAEVVTDYFTAIGGWGGVAMLLVSILFTGGMLRISLGVFRLRAQLAGVQRIPDATRKPMPGGEKVLLAVGILLCLLLYGVDVLMMLTT